MCEEKLKAMEFGDRMWVMHVGSDSPSLIWEADYRPKEVVFLRFIATKEGDAQRAQVAFKSDGNVHVVNALWLCETRDQAIKWIAEELFAVSLSIKKKGNQVMSIINEKGVSKDVKV